MPGGFLHGQHKTPGQDCRHLHTDPQSSLPAPRQAVPTARSASHFGQATSRLSIRHSFLQGKTGGAASLRQGVILPFNPALQSFASEGFPTMQMNLF